MLKKFVSILMMFSALAIMLGHNLIGHHHHDFEQNEISHHHNDRDHHNDGDYHNDGRHHDSDTEDDCDDWGHPFSYLLHDAGGLTFLKSHSPTDDFSKQIPPFIPLHISNFVFQQAVIEVRQNAPPYFADYYNSQNSLPSGLRAPPALIV